MKLHDISQSANFIDEGKNLKLVDAPVSGGSKRASMGTLTVCIHDLFFNQNSSCVFA